MKLLFSLLLLGSTLLLLFPSPARSACDTADCVVTVQVYNYLQATTARNVPDNLIYNFDSSCNSAYLGSNQGYTFINAGEYYYQISYYKYYYQNGWFQIGAVISDTRVSLRQSDYSSPSANWTNIQTAYPNGCPSCTEESLNAEASAACGTLFYVNSVNLNECTFNCVPCSSILANCKSEYFPLNVTQECQQTTREDGTVSSLTVGACVPDNDTDCADRKINCDSACGDSSLVVKFDCDTGECVCRPKSCNDYYADCLSECGGDIYQFTCSDNTAQHVCTCNQVPASEEDPKDYTTPPSDDNTTNPTNNNEQTSDPEDADSASLKKIVENTKATSENVKALNETVNRELNELNRTTEKQLAYNILQNANLGKINSNINTTNSKLAGIDKSLAGIKGAIEDLDTSGGDSYEIQAGELNLGNDNVYSTDIIQPEENDLTETITGYISSGLPLSQFIASSGFSTSNIDPSLTFDFYGHAVDFDISPMQSILHWMGLIVFSVSTITAFMIIIKR